MTESQAEGGSWLKAINPYQWTVLGACYGGGMFDGLDSSLFTAVLPIAVAEMIGTQDPIMVSQKGSIIAALFLLGWTTGGMVFGMLADRIGRVKALTLSILIYALFTGLCGTAHTWQSLALYRFMTALGIGGELIVGTTLLAESWPNQYRARAVGILTTAYQGGVSLVGIANFVLGALSWRYLFFAGAVPALLVMWIRSRVHEPEHWVKHQQKADADKANFFHLFRKEHIRQALVAGTFTGALLVAYWASSFWIPAWVHQLLPGKKPVFEVSMILLLQGLFAMGGSTWAGFLAQQIGRRPTLFLANIGYLLTSLAMFNLNHEFSNMIYVWGSAMGIFIGMCISICYIYVPELFPTRLRATGTGFSFNLGRIVSALAVIFSSQLINFFGGSYAQAASSMAYFLIVGCIVVWFVHETNGKELLE